MFLQIESSFLLIEFTHLCARPKLSLFIRKYRFWVVEEVRLISSLQNKSTDLSKFIEIYRRKFIDFTNSSGMIYVNDEKLGQILNIE